ncbi:MULTISPECIES: NlpC/P60 family protein [Treponema]|uniref:NlpC/P60 family protein n=1 Tax=Treponema TaxID=157 RepID=UPI003F01E819
MNSILKTAAVLIFALTFSSCKNEENSPDTITDCPESIAQKAYEYAVKYKDSDTIYEWGGQDALRAIKIDCSGLVVRCYQYAVQDTKFLLCFDDCTSYGMLNYSTPTSKPRTGDLIFMGEADSEQITHIALYNKEEDGEIYFIDSTSNETVCGVSERHYPRDSKKFKSFGIMHLKF